MRSVRNNTDETEFYTPLPDGYKPGSTKYIAVFGTVMSGLGKGIFSSSLAKLLKDKGLTVSPIKLEGYLNIDSGTLNPFRHGEVFVLDDGMETDMDLGTYERMLDQDLTGANFATSGQIYRTVLDKERAGGYLGRDVQMIPHVTGEVKHRLRSLAVKNDADIVAIEVGGTVGDIENAFYIEALRELSYEEGPENVMFVALTYVLDPPTLGEQKSKAAQLGVKRLMEYGINPHIVACRAEREVDEKVRQKISVYTNVPMRRVFSMHDLPSIYLLPGRMREAGLDSEVVQVLGLGSRVNSATDAKNALAWQQFASRIGKAGTEVRIGITGKYVALRDSYASIIKALEHAGVANDAKVGIDWIDTTDVTAENVAEKLAAVDGIIVPGGFGVRGTEGKIECIRYAREHAMPYLGICMGFQMAVIEYARNVCGLASANSTEMDPDCDQAVISILPEQKEIEGLGGNMRLGGQDVIITPETVAAELFGGAEDIRQRFRHRFEVDPAYIEQLEGKGLVFSGRHPQHPIMQILELPPSVHPYFVAAQFHPELTSRPLRPQPMFAGLVRAALAYAAGEPGQSKSA
ncbi:MAG: CTP synthase [Planctomycetes bacterium]|nr:CTP synthase [Phycisphaerae bacterium]NBB94790.1 CTP synthase [Planctomycetota bacterium]